ncbi:hypothetical protein ACTXT7_007166 [Hymenolepis weldensis]
MCSSIDKADGRLRDNLREQKRSFDCINASSPPGNNNHLRLPNARRIRAFSDCFHQNRSQKYFSAKLSDRVLSLVSESLIKTEETSSNKDFPPLKETKPLPVIFMDDVTNNEGEFSFSSSTRTNDVNKSEFFALPDTTDEKTQSGL